MGALGIQGLPDTTHFGDTIRNMHVWVVNTGNSAVSGLVVQVMAAPNLTGNPFSIGTLDLTLGLMQPGDSAEVPLDYFVVSPQNSNNGSNVMVIWPTAPGTPPQDTAHGDYWVEPITATQPRQSAEASISIYPNPTVGPFRLQRDHPATAAETLEVYAADGLLVDRRRLTTGSEIDLGFLPSGLYRLGVTNAKGELWSGKLLIQK